MDEIKLSQLIAEMNKVLDCIIPFPDTFADALHLKKLIESFESLVNKNKDWIYLKDKSPKDEEIIWGSTGDRAWVFKWSEEYNHFLEYTDKRGGRWEYTTLSSKVIKWHPLPE